MPAPGTIVTVPLGRRETIGVVWDDAPESALPDRRLKPVLGRIDTPDLPETLRRFIDWVAGYTMAKRGDVLSLALKRGLLEPPSPRAGWRLPETRPDVRLTEARRKVLTALASLDAPTTTDLAEAAGVSQGVVRAMGEAGLILPCLRHATRTAPDPGHPGPALAPDQQEVAADLAAMAAARRFEPALLEGVTGSGKTEVYLEAVAETLRQGRQALVLLPEIALSAQMVERFAARFGAPPLVWHSAVRPSARREAYHAIAGGIGRLVVGARSALFLPFADLGLIVVDEEHETAYKQEDGVIYHARDMAVVRASLSKIPIVLVSATPSLETLVNVAQGRYRRLHLPARFGAAQLPEIRVVDMRRHPPERQRFLSPPLVAALGRTLEAGEQAMLFLNRRGYAPLTLCRACGHRLECPNCTAWLVEHRLLGRLQCHHCGHSENLPALCPQCGAAQSFVPCGPGIERLSEEMAARFPAARLGVMSSDTLTGPHAAETLIHAVEAHEIDVVIGTQVVAKGHHFPLLTLVGVIDADLGLEGGDLRAAERTFQLLHQVAGRAGREERPRTVYIQTWTPEHGVIAALLADDRDRFFALEAESRKAHGMPPFGRLAAVILAAPDEQAADVAAHAFARAVPHLPGVETLGPAPAPLRVLRGRHRRRFLLKARRDVNLQAVLRQWLARVKVPSNVRVQVDVDPYSFL